MPSTSQEVHDLTREILLPHFTEDYVDDMMDMAAEDFLKGKGWRFRNGLMREPGRWEDTPKEEKILARYLIEEWDYAFAEA